MDSWNQFNQILLPKKEGFNGNLNLEILLRGYKNVWNIFNTRNIGDFCDLFVQSDTLLLTNILKILFCTCLKTNKLDPDDLCSVHGLAW